MNRKYVMLFAFVIVFAIENATSINDTIDIVLSNLEFDENASKIVVYAACRENISDIAIDEIKIDLWFRGFYFEDFNKTVDVALNESMEYSTDIPENVYGKVNISVTARTNPLMNESNITNNEKNKIIYIENKNIIQEKKLLEQFVFVVNTGMVFFILAGMLLVLVRRDKV
jgi:hypothetical protein